MQYLSVENCYLSL